MKPSRQRRWGHVCLNSETPKQTNADAVPCGGLRWRHRLFPRRHCSGAAIAVFIHSSLFWGRFGQIWSEPRSPGPTCVSVIGVTGDSWMKRKWPVSLALVSFHAVEERVWACWGAHLLAALVQDYWNKRVTEGDEWSQELAVCCMADCSPQKPPLSFLKPPVQRLV